MKRTSDLKEGISYLQGGIVKHDTALFFCVLSHEGLTKIPLGVMVYIH